MSDDNKTEENGVINLSHEKLFLEMMKRKQTRILYGPVLKKINQTFIFGWVLLLATVIAQGLNTEKNEETKSTKITIKIRDAFFFLGNSFVILLTIFISSSYHFRMFVMWFFLLNPIGHGVLSLVIFQDVYFNDHIVLSISFAVIGVLILFGYIFTMYIMPCITNSAWLARSGFARWFWSLKLESDNKITYRSRKFWKFSEKYICSYKGETDSEGLPHGQGTWYGFSYNGEILEGNWCHGVPVAPFVSREYGTGTVTKAVQIILYIATDDAFDSSSVPSHDLELKAAIVGVECCVMGNFYNNFPLATLMTEPKVIDGDTTIGDLCKGLLYVGNTRENVETSSLTIHLSKPNGLQVKGFRYDPTGASSCYSADHLALSVHNLNRPRIDNASLLFRGENNRLRMSIPFASSISTRKVTGAISEGKDEEPQQESPSLPNDVGKVDEIEEPLKKSDEKPYFEIKEWSPRLVKDALIYFPGFNSEPRKSSGSLGQLLAMTNIRDYVYPIIFCWPNGTVIKYRKSSKYARSKKTVERFASLLKDLQKSGIQNVHLLSHSMGAQAMLHGFNCDADGSRSELSACFKLVENYNPGISSSRKLVCKSITIMNPDYPLCVFIDETFHSIRKICSNITLIGDQYDKALMFSMYVNGFTNRAKFGTPQVFGGKVYEPIQSCIPTQLVIGRSVDKLCLSDNFDRKELFKQPSGKSNERHFSKENKAGQSEQLWLDLDVIDTTSLDTNIKGMRHNAFRANPILSHDLEEIIASGERASKRSGLMHRHGNIFSFCHAPSHVAF